MRLILQLFNGSTLRGRLGLSGLWCVLTFGHCALRPAVTHAEEPPSNAFYHEFFGRRGYSDPQVEQNLRLGMMNGLTFSPPVEDGVARAVSPYGAGLMLRLAGAAGPAATSESSIEQQRVEFNRLSANTTASWNLMPEWDQSGGSWVPNGRPHYTGLSRRDADARFFTYYQTAFPSMMRYLRQPAEGRSYLLASVTDHAPSVYHAYELGVEMQYLERGIDELGDLSTGLAFIRGAARQYNRQWGIDFSSWRTSNNSATNYSDNGVLLGGWSASYFRRNYYAAFAGGARNIMNEAATYRYSNGQLNPFGDVNREFADFALRDHADLAQPVVHTAILIDHHAGFDPKHGIYNQDNAVWYQDIPYNSGDYMLDNFFRLAYPNHQQHGRAPGAPFADAAGVPNESRFRTFLAAGGDVRPYEPMPTTRWGDNLDVLTNEAPLEALNHYRVLILMGTVELTPRLRADLRDWVDRGGVLVMNAAQAESVDEELLGVTLLGQSRAGSTSRWLPATAGASEPAYDYAFVRPVTAEVLATSESGDPLITRRRLGAGEAYLTTPVYLQSRTRQQLLQVGTQLLDSLFNRFSPARLSGPPIEYVVGATQDKVVVTLINNSGVEWAGNVLIDRPRGFNRVMEYIKEQPLPYRLARREVTIPLRVPPYEVRVVALEHSEPVAASFAPVVLKSSGTEP